MSVTIRPVTGKADRKRFVDVAYRLNAADPNWIPPLRAEAFELITPGKNPFYEHAKQQLFLAPPGPPVIPEQVLADVVVRAGEPLAVERALPRRRQTNQDHTFHW